MIGGASHPAYLTADAVVLAGQGEDMRLLVIRRANEPGKGEWALPGGFLEDFEQPLNGVLRELREETGLNLPHSAGVPLSPRLKRGRDPRGWIVSQPFLFWSEEPQPVRAGDDAADAAWLPLAELDELAFDHGAMLCEALGKFWDTMPDHHVRLFPVLGFGEPVVHTDEVIFFGGSFNPWHQGHDACLELCGQPEKVVIVPDTNPFKQGPGNRCFWQTYRAILEHVKPLKCQVYPGFCGLERPNPTVTWVPFTRYDRRAFLMGDDALRDLPTWNEAELLVHTLDEIFVVERLGKGVARSTREWIKRHQPELIITSLGEHPYQHLSSTALRNGRNPVSKK